MFNSKSLIAIALLLAISKGQALSADDSWFFSAEEIANAYRYQRQYGARLYHPLKPGGCLYRQKEFIASVQRSEFSVPCPFITETIRHLKEILESGAAKYLFQLDLGHAQFAIPTPLWKTKYGKLPKEKSLPALIRERSLAALYHTAEHLDPGTINKNPAMDMWGKKRRVMGFYDGRRIEILSPNSDGSVSYEPEGYKLLDGFTVLAHPLGELLLVVGGSVTTFDISFDDERGVVAAPTAANVRTKPR